MTQEQQKPVRTLFGPPSTWETPEEKQIRLEKIYREIIEDVKSIMKKEAEAAGKLK